MHRYVQLGPVCLMIHSTHLKLVYLDYSSYGSLALEKGGEGRNGLFEFADFLCADLLRCTNHLCNYKGRGKAAD